MTARIPKELVEKARQTDTVEYLRHKGEEMKKSGSDYYPVRHDSLKVRNNVFYWHSREIGGNTVDLAKALYGFDFCGAVDDILKSGARVIPCGERTINRRAASNGQPADQKSMPEKATDEKRVIAYLCRMRGLDYTLVKTLIAEELIYQDVNGNCVFVVREYGRAKYRNELKVVGAEIVGTATMSRYKQDSVNKNYAFTMETGNWTKDCSPTFIYFESAIDLLSYYQLYKLDDCSEPTLLISLRGVKPAPFKQNFRYSTNFPNARHFIATDNDRSGDEFAEKMIAEWKQDASKNGNLSRYIIKRLRPDERYKDWNDMLRDIPKSNG